MIELSNDEIVFFNVYGIFLRWTKHSSFSYLMSPRPNHGLMHILCDRIQIEYPNGSTELFHKGNIIYIPEGLQYSVKFFGDTDYLEALLINFSADGAVPFCNKVKKLVDRATSSHTDCFNAIISLYVQTKNYRYSVMEWFYRLLSKISIQTEGAVSEDKSYISISPAITQIETNINTPLRIPELAKMCLLSETVFRKRFKLCTKKTPSEYISDLKLEKACELLKSRDIPIYAIVSELNFYDSAYFHKLFRKKYGVSPSAFRSSL